MQKMTADRDEQIEFDDFRANDELVRTVFLNRLRRERSWNHLDLNGFESYVRFVNGAAPAHLFVRLMRVFWQLVQEGIVVPGHLMAAANISGLGGNELSLPRFSLTPYGADVLNAPEFNPHFPKAYMRDLIESASPFDATVVAYMQEAVDNFRRGSRASAMIMLGVASERVFLQVCDAVLNALTSEQEKKRFEAIFRRLAMKPKLDWIAEKFRHSERTLPEGTALMVVAIYDLVRMQRNELGHPSDEPPNVSLVDGRARLQMFPALYSNARILQKHLLTHPL
jgi:hypothetical protein